MTLTVLKSSGQVFCKRVLDLGFPGISYEYAEVMGLEERFQEKVMLFSCCSDGRSLPTSLITDAVSSDHLGWAGVSPGEKIHFPFIC